MPRAIRIPSRLRPSIPRPRVRPTIPANIGFGFRFDPKRSFFDAAEVINRLDAVKRRAFETAGRFIRSDAQRSMRRVRSKKAFHLRDETVRQQIRNLRFAGEQFSRSAVSMEIAASQFVASKPGKPPHTHAPRGHFVSIRDRINFAYDAVRDSVVVGPALLPGGGTRPTIPESLEFGGARRVTVRLPVGRRRVQFVAQYPARPYMGPALEKNLRNEKLLKLFEDII